jgi:uncharacterized protein YybS (DUF2232 family)
MLPDTMTREWLICSAIGFVLFVVGVFMPFLAMPIIVIYPFPLILLTYKRGPSCGLLSVFFVAFAVFFLFSATLSIIYFIAFGLSGILLGVASRRVKGVELVLLGISCSLICKLTAVFFVYRATGVNLLSPDMASIEQMFMSIAESHLPSLAGGDLPGFRQNLSNNLYYIVMLVPFSLILLSSTEVLLSYGLSSRLHRRRTGEDFFELPPFGSWAFPKNTIIALVIGFVCELAAGWKPEISYTLKQLSANLGAITWTLFTIQGLAVAYYFMELRGFPKITRVAIIVLTPIIPVLGIIFSVVGIVDIGIDLRKWARGKHR